MRIPVCAPVLKPMRSGEPKGLRVMVWKRAPATPRARPATSPSTIRGSFHFTTTTWTILRPCPWSASMTSWAVTGNFPNRRETTATARLSASSMKPTMTWRGVMSTDRRPTTIHRRPASAPTWRLRRGSVPAGGCSGEAAWPGLIPLMRPGPSSAGP